MLVENTTGIFSQGVLRCYSLLFCARFWNLFIFQVHFDLLSWKITGWFLWLLCIDPWRSLMFPMFVYLLFKEFVSESSKIKETAEMKTNTREGTVLFFFLLQFVCMGGSTNRIKHFAKFIQGELKDYLKDDNEPLNMSKSDRYVLYKVGPVLAVNVSSFQWCPYKRSLCLLNC